MLEVVDAAVEAHVANEARLLDALPGRDRTELDRILRTLLDSLGAGDPGPPAP